MATPSSMAPEWPGQARKPPWTSRCDRRAAARPRSLRALTGGPAYTGEQSLAPLSRGRDSNMRTPPPPRGTPRSACFLLPSRAPPRNLHPSQTSVKDAVVHKLTKGLLFKQEEVSMLIHDFHSKLMSGKDEGSLFEALRRLKSVDRAATISEQEPGLWSEWTDTSGLEETALMAKARA